jgi:hypothetical protein
VYVLGVGTSHTRNREEELKAQFPDATRASSCGSTSNEIRSASGHRAMAKIVAITRIAERRL